MTTPEEELYVLVHYPRGLDPFVFGQYAASLESAKNRREEDIGYGKIRIARLQFVEVE